MTLFEKIIAREIPAEIVFEDDSHIAFLDIKPIKPGHLLVVPKKVIGDILEMEDQDYIELMRVAKKIAIKLKQATEAKRIGFLIEGFAIDHVHVHLVPINSGQELEPNQAVAASAEELAAIANVIRKTLI